jgi:hypothetical protein
LSGERVQVLFIPPPPFYTGRRRNFEEDLHSYWYGTVVLLFRMTVESKSSEASSGNVTCTTCKRPGAPAECFLL